MAMSEKSAFEFFAKINLKTLAYRLVDSIGEHIVQYTFFLDVCDITRLCDEVVGTMLEILTAQLYVTQDG